MQTRSISGELCIYTVASEKQALMEFLDSDDDLEITLAEVCEIDTAGLQLLIALKREAFQRQKKLHYRLHSKAVLEILELSNLMTVFGDPIILETAVGRI